MPALRIVYLLPNGEEHEEEWPSVSAFRAWAEKRHQRLQYSAFTQDSDGEWVLHEKGRVAGDTESVEDSPGR